ncbi:MAG: tyrosine--tRNA ligase [Verrucomicrobiota bacterium]
MKSVEEQKEALCQGAAQIISEKELLNKLARNQPLRVKLGVDPTAPDIHLGHTVVLEKLRQFQEWGHQAVLIIGDFTATIGDPSGRSATRPPLSREEVLAHAETYTAQAFKVLDRDRTEIVYNGDWFRQMTYEQVLRLNASVTMQQMLQREDFRNRIEKGQEVRLHEIQYPIVQGWDSVEVKADVEIGGTDQLFNILVGRDLQKEQGMEQQVVLCMPLLEGTDGVKKMSKSYGNYIGVADSPDEMFGKVLSISDQLMRRYYLLLLGQEMDDSVHPMEAKKSLAGQLVARYHDQEAARAAWANFEARFGQNDQEATWPEVTISQTAAETGLLAIVSEAYAKGFQSQRSNADLRRLVQQGSVQLNGEKLEDPKIAPALKPGDLLKLDKKRSVRIA